MKSFEQWDAEQYAWEKSRPTCDECGEPIFEEFLFRIDGECTCEACMDKKIKYLWDQKDGMKCSCCGATGYQLKTFDGELYCETCMDKLYDDLKSYIA